MYLYGMAERTSYNTTFISFKFIQTWRLDASAEPELVALLAHVITVNVYHR